MLLLSIEGLLNGFYDDYGCNEAMYNATYSLIENVISPQASRLFSEAMKNVHGRYYLPEAISPRKLFVDMINCSI